MARNFNWECSYCRKQQVVTDSNFDTDAIHLHKTQSADIGYSGIIITSIVCSNVACKKLTLSAAMRKMKDIGPRYEASGAVLQTWSLMPESSAKPQPDIIPGQIVQDYEEACRIKELSPKASATLSRRCVQGIIRDFCKISKARLIDEITELRKLGEEDKLPRGVTHDTIDAIDHVRSIGNIGAHFEKDINVIVEVDPNEAQALIDLIEMLFEEWYVAADTREKKLKRIKEIKDQKDGDKKQNKSAKG